MQKRLVVFALLVVLLLAEDVDYREGGKEWEEDQCGTGKQQSPIDIKTDKVVFDRDLKFNLAFDDNIPANIVDNGATFKVTSAVPYDFFTASNTADKVYSYTPLNFHFHSPAEHTINGVRHDLELHLVHTMDQASLASAGQINRTLAVVGVFFKVVEDSECNTHEFFDSLLVDSVSTTTQSIVLNLKSNLAKHLQPPFSFYNYEGGLTTPPCTEAVNWYVLPHVLKIGKSHFHAFKDAWSGNPNFANGRGNNRKTQPLNGRTVKEGKVAKNNAVVLEAKLGAEEVLVANLGSKVNKKA